MVNISGLQNATSFYDVLVYDNYITGQLFMGLFLIALVFIIFMMVKGREEFEESILIASFAGLVFSIFLKALNLINFLYVLAFIIILAGYAMYNLVVKRRC